MKNFFAFFLDRRKFGGHAKVQKVSASKNIFIFLVEKKLKECFFLKLASAAKQKIPYKKCNEFFYFRKKKKDYLCKN
jgi:hypothetical protein